MLLDSFPVGVQKTYKLVHFANVPPSLRSLPKRARTSKGRTQILPKGRITRILERLQSAHKSVISHCSSLEMRFVALVKEISKSQRSRSAHCRVSRCVLNMTKPESLYHKTNRIFSGQEMKDVATQRFLIFC